MSAKNESKIQTFAMEISKTTITWVESQVKLFLGGIFCEEFFYKTLVCHVWYFS
jgi:hypothetical protein